MTVRELIEHLQTLDQDKGIWVFYDFPCAAFPPTPDDTADEYGVRFFGDLGVKEGDYVINAG